MKKALYIILILASFLPPLQKMDIAKLRPIEVISIRKHNGLIIATTDTDEYGVGYAAVEALKDLKRNSVGIVYLDTAKYLLVSDLCVDQIESLRPYLKGTVQLCRLNSEEDLKEIAQYLSTHYRLMKLRNWKKGSELVEICVS